jgi:Flp pilus assembly CpaF family ATPase
MEEELIKQRMDAIISELADLPQTEFCEVPMLEVINDKGDIKLTLAGTTTLGIRKTAERVIAFNDPLDAICDIFTYPDYIGRLSKDIAVESVKDAFINEYGHLMVTHKDGSMESFKIKENHRDEIISKLKDHLGDKLKIKL